MRILSNFKDYYDYIAGRYGIDQSIIYERVGETRSSQYDETWSKTGIYKPNFVLYPYDPKFFPAPLMPDYSTEKRDQVYSYFIAICGILYCVYRHNGKFYYGDEVMQVIPKQIYKSKWRKYAFETKHYNNSEFHLTKTDFNNKENCPVLLLNENRTVAMAKNIRLADFGIGSCLPADKAYLQISQFITREKPIKDNRTNIEKILGHGFDKITSFRKPKQDGK